MRKQSKTIAASRGKLKGTSSNKTYSIVIRYFNGDEERIERKRFDAFKFQAHKAVYDVANRQGLRDTRAAWNALRHAQDMGRNGLENIRFGQYLIILNS